MNAPETSNNQADVLTDAAVIELTDPIQPLPEDDAPIIELTDRLDPATDNRTSPFERQDDIDAKDQIADEPPRQAVQNDNDWLALVDSASTGDGQKALEGDLVYDDEMPDDFDSQQDDFVDSLGMEIPQASDTIETPGQSEPLAAALSVPSKDGTDPGMEAVVGPTDAPALSPEKLEATLERVIEKIYAEKIEGILVETIERVVVREIERIKTALTGDRDSDEQR